MVIEINPISFKSRELSYSIFQPVCSGEAEMVKPRVDNETPDEKFKRIASMRTQRVLDDLRLLGNCSNTATYKYTKVEVDKIFSTIEKETKRVKNSFNKPVSEFSLG